MKFYQNLSIKSKLLGIIIFVTLIVLSTGFTINVIHNIKTFKKDMVDHNIATAQVIGDYCAGALLFQDINGAEKILEKLTSVPSIVHAVVYDTSGNLFASLKDVDERIIAPVLLKNQSSQFFNNLLHVYQPIHYNNEFYGMIYLSSSTSSLSNKIGKHLQNMIYLIIVLIFISIIIASWLQRIISKPILHLADVAKQITKEDNYSIRVEKFGNDETGVLCDGFNNMLDQIQDREQARDIAETSLKERNEQLSIFKKFAEASTQGMGIANLDGQFFYANPALKKMLGVQGLMDHYSKDMAHLYQNEHQQLSEKILPIVFEKGQWSGELPIKTKQGNLQTCIQAIFLIKDDNGNAINLATIITDITERKRFENVLAKHKEHLEEKVEQRTIELLASNRKLQGEIEERKQADRALRASEASLANAQRIAHLGNWDWDIAENKLIWSEEIYRIFGLRREKFGSTYDDFMKTVHPDDRKKVEQIVKTALADKKSFGFDHRIIQPNGSEIIVHEQAEVFTDKSGKAVRMTGTVQDITIRKKAEEELKRTQAHLIQSEKMASLGILVAGVAHEINTPVGAISSMYNTLSRAIDKVKGIIDSQCKIEETENKRMDKLFSIIEEANQVIASATDRVTNIVRRLKSFARLDEAEYEKVNINNGLEDTLTIVHHELKHKVELERNYGDIPDITCNPGQLNQVYLNILINAIQSIKEKGKITISTFSENDKVKVQIKDTGCGIPKDSISKIFDPGFTTKGVGVGTGLGLSICYQIIHEHGGKISVESEVGSGTTFTISLPLTSPDISKV